MTERTTTPPRDLIERYADAFERFEKSQKDTPNDDFQFHVPVSFFEKSGAPEGFRRRIGGLVSTQGKDQEGETILQRGLDFNYFMTKGFFNDNHDKRQVGILGFPDHVQFFKKGAKLPDGGLAPNDGHWAEGYLLEGWGPADQIWSLGQAMRKTKGARRLGFSIEGSIQKRAGHDRKTIAKASVKHVAITHCPVNPETGLAILEKSLEAAEQEEHEKALSVGAGSSQAPVGPKTGEGAGAVLTPESLERDKKKVIKSFSRAEAVNWTLAQFPNINTATAGRFVDAALLLKKAGLL